MAVAPSVPFRGAWTPVMNEYFASMADVHRILGVLPEGMPTCMPPPTAGRRRPRHPWRGSRA